MKNILLLFLLWGSAAFATEVENPNFMPFGEQEAFLGNAGIALEGSSGAVFYNPGSLGFITDRKVSVYGNAYAFNRLNLRTSVAFEQPDLIVKSNSSSSVPLSSVTIFGSQTWTYAFSINTPYNSEVEFTIPYQANNVDFTLSQSSSENSLWIGPSVARQVSPDFSVGASLFLARYSSSNNSISYAIFNTPSSTTLSAMKVTSSNWSALMVLGAQWRISPKWNAGLRIQTASLGLRGRADYFSVSQRSGATPFTSKEAESGIHTRYRRPFNFGIGSQYTPRAGLSFLLDVHAQLPIHYNTTPSRALINGRIDTKFTPRLNFGGKWQASTAHQLLFGFLYNPSTLPGTGSTAAGEMREKFKGVSLGLQKEMGALTSSVGGFYLWSSVTQGIPGFSGTSSLKHQIFGLLLTASYRL